MSPQRTDELIGSTVLGRYRIMHSLAEGGMGAVFLGRTEGAEGFARPVVIKRVLPDLMKDDSVAQLFIREASILSHLQHPNIVSVLDFGQADDGAYVMVLEYVHGFQLGHWLHYVKKVRGQVEPDLALQVIIKVCDALHYAHTFKQSNGEALQIVHRDVSPSNVMLTQQGVVKLLDFGIARVSGRGRATDSGGLQGKLPYLPPEAFRGAEPTVQGDVYACGVLLHELLSGTNPFTADTAAELRRKVEENKPTPLHALREDLPEAIDEVIGHALHRVPEARHESAAELSAALRKMRSRADDAVTERLSTVLSQDFGPRLAQMVGVLPLALREKAWRGAGPLSIKPRAPDADLSHESPTVRAQADEKLMRELRPSEHPTVPPEGRTTAPSDDEARQLQEAIAEELAARDPESHDRETFEFEVVPADGPANVPAPAAPPPPPPPAPLGAPTPQQQPATTDATSKSATRFLWPAIALIALAVAGALSTRPASPPPPPSDEFVVIEREDVTPEAETPKPTAPTSPGVAARDDGGTRPEPAPAAQGDGPSVPAPKADARRATASSERKNSTPRQLTIHLKRRRTQFEKCFETHAKELAGRPKLELRFQLEPSGKIQLVQLFPEALAPTDLGSCLLKVARGTRFPRQKELTAFRIPITAITRH